MKAMQYLKMNLLSRNKNKQALGVKNILKVINSKTSTATSEMLISADIPGLLCDIMNIHNPQLIMQMFYCLLELSKHEEFYRQKHSTVVIETTCRTIKILSSEAKNRHIVHKGIELLIKVLTRCKRESTINLHEVIEIISLILGSSAFQSAHLATVNLFKIILQAEDFDHKDLPDLVYLTLTLFFKLRKNNVSRFTKCIKLALDMMIYSLRYFSNHQNRPLAEKATGVVMSLIESFVIPSLKDIDPNECPNITMRKLNCILEIYNCLNQKKQYFLSSHLAAEGYLTLLPDLDQQFENIALHKCVMNLLYHILALLASKELKFPMSHCQQIIGKGLKKFPADTTKWAEFFAETQPNYVYMTIITYLYFVILCDCHDSVNNSSTLLPVLCNYLLSQHSVPPPPTCKALCFVFAVLYLSCPKDIHRELLLASRQVTQWLKCSTLDQVFTHHPAMLYWLFSTQENDKILQINSIVLWMKNKSPASRNELKDLVLKIDEAALRVLDLLNCCSEDLLFEVVSLLKAVLARDKSERRKNMSMHIWNNVSSTLSFLSTPGWGKRLKNMCLVIFLACEAVPQNLNVPLMLRITQQLVQIFQKSCGKAWEDTLRNIQNTDIQLLLSQLFKLTYVVISKMNLTKDYRGLKMFLDEESLRRGLLACLDSDNMIVIHHALKLITRLQHSQKLYNIEIKNRGTVMGAEFFLQLMTTKTAHTAFHSANIFSNLRVMYPKAFLTLSNDMSASIIHTLYQEFQNLSVRHDTSSLSWKCQNKLLQYCHHYNRQMEEQLLYFPLTIYALQVAFMKTAGIGDIHLAEYIYTFLKAAKSHNLVGRCNYGRIICRDPVSTVLSVVAEQLLTKNWPTDSLHAVLIYQIYKSGANIPLQTMQAMKLKVRYRPNKGGDHK